MAKLIVVAPSCSGISHFTFLVTIIESVVLIISIFSKEFIYRSEFKFICLTVLLGSVALPPSLVSFLINIKIKRDTQISL